MARTKRWKVCKTTGGWLFHHSRRPAHRHLCFRGMLSGTLCGVRESQPDAFKAALSRYRQEEFERQRVVAEWAPPPGWRGLQDTGK